jgi:hypothetical protein
MSQRKVPDGLKHGVGVSAGLRRGAGARRGVRLDSSPAIPHRGAHAADRARGRSRLLLENGDAVYRSG